MSLATITLDVPLMGVIIAALGLLGSLGGLVFWLGRERGRLSELMRRVDNLEHENKATYTRLESKMETHVHELSRRQEKLAERQTKTSEDVRGIKEIVRAANQSSAEKFDVVFEKLDKMTDVLVEHMSKKR